MSSPTFLNTFILERRLLEFKQYVLHMQIVKYSIQHSLNDLLQCLLLSLKISTEMMFIFIATS